MRTPKFESIVDLADDIRSKFDLDLSRNEMLDLLHYRRAEFGRYCDIDARQYAAICRAIWEDATRSPYPADWSIEDAIRIVEEAAEEE